LTANFTHNAVITTCTTGCQILKNKEVNALADFFILIVEN